MLTEIEIEKERTEMREDFAIIVGGFLLCCGIVALARWLEGLIS